MAQLEFMALAGLGEWQGALNATSAQLGPYKRYLETILRSAPRRQQVLAWREPDQETLVQLDRRALKRRRRRLEEDTPRTLREAVGGHWILLEDPPEAGEETAQSTYESFLDTQTKCVYDQPLTSRRRPRGYGIKVADRDDEFEALNLERRPAIGSAGAPRVWLRPNTYGLECQQRALETLRNSPPSWTAPLIRLMTPARRDQQAWAPVERVTVSEWRFLAARPGERLREGTDEQQKFVLRALGTPDFAILEGPPGSGKTRAICELVSQLLVRGQRVLVVASTHVAVDNVLERLLEHDTQKPEGERLALPVRIGDEERVSDAVVDHTLNRCRRTWREKLSAFLQRPERRTGVGAQARRLLQDELADRQQGNAIDNLILESANVVCGTTIGILQHPHFRDARRSGAVPEPFDVLILDEASKTTFLEFLVPAVHARKWIIVGDVRQLSPYVEQSDLADNLRALLPDEEAGLAAVLGFLTSRLPNPLDASPDEPPPDQASRPRHRLVVRCEGTLAEHLRLESQARRLLHLDLDSAKPSVARGEPEALLELLYADLVFGSGQALSAHEDRLPADLEGFRLPKLPRWERRREHVLGGRRKVPRPLEAEAPRWADEVAWRLVRAHELRSNEDERLRYAEEIDGLLPCASRPATGGKLRSAEDVQQRLGEIRRAALPSILELLQRGFERLPNQRDGVALTDGLPADALAARLVSLTYQHRMHPELSAFPRAAFYDDKLLRDSTGLADERPFAFGRQRYRRRAHWIHVLPARGDETDGVRNPAEARVVADELQAFAAWAEANRRYRSDGSFEPWTVAVLTFHRPQERELREQLRRLSGQGRNTRNFLLPRGASRDGGAVQVVLCVVDRFQGHEADVVFLSMALQRKGFLSSASRLNVGITRARYQLVVVGNRERFRDERMRSALLNRFADSELFSESLPVGAER